MQEVLNKTPVTCVSLGLGPWHKLSLLPTQSDVILLVIHMKRAHKVGNLLTVKVGVLVTQD